LPAEPRNRRGDCGVDVGARGDVDLGSERVLRADVVGQRLHGILLQIGDDDRAALGGDAPDDGLPDAPSRSRHERDLAFKPPHHHSSDRCRNSSYTVAR
jgi:hypothetical protein